MLEGLSCGEPLSAEAFEEIKCRAALEAFKWNIADKGVDKLADFPLIVTGSLWRQLSDWAVRLSAEAESAEAELLTRPLLRAALGIPWRLQRAIGKLPTNRGLRYSRFDFHPIASGGFAITEGNLDVAGGWNESSGVAPMFAEHVRDAECAGDAVVTLTMRVAQKLGPDKAVGIMHFTRYADDHQVARFVARAFERCGLNAVFFDPTQLRSAGDRAGALVGERVLPLDAIFRFFPAEWSCRLGNSGAWLDAASKPGTLWVNPLSSVLTQSKRFPLTWPALQTPLPTWSRLLPETRGPMFVGGGEWVFKPAMGHEGYEVGVPGASSPKRLRELRQKARRRPWRWVAQRPFSPQSIMTPRGPRFPCIGVYVIDGVPAGLYGRLSDRALIDDEAQDVVILVRP